MDGATDSVGAYASLAIGVDGYPVISYYDFTNDDLKVVHCTNAACSTFDTPRTVDDGSSPAFGAFTSLAIGADGNPIISYGGTGGDLMVAHCDDPACTAATARVVDVAGNLQGYMDTSIAIGVDGYPIVSYHDYGFRNDLKVVHCTNVACTANDPPRTLDSDGPVGAYTSLAIGLDGNPVISYQDDYDDDLKMVRCTDPACATNELPRTLDSGWVPNDSSLAIGTDGLVLVSYDGDSALKVARVGG